MDPIIVQKTATATTTLIDSQPGEADGTFIAKVSVYSIKDLHGDVMEPGSFKKSLDGLMKSGKQLPAVWAHQFSNPQMFLGKYFEWEDNDSELILKGRLNLAWPTAKMVHELYKEGLVDQFSWSGRVSDYDLIEKGDEFFDEENEWMNGARIKEVDLWEAGPTFRGANPETALVGVKTLLVPGSAAVQAKASGDLMDALRDVHSKIGKALASADSTAAEKDESANSGASTLQESPGTSGSTDQAAELKPTTRALLALANI